MMVHPQEPVPRPVGEFCCAWLARRRGFSEPKREAKTIDAVAETIRTHKPGPITVMPEAEGKPTLNELVEGSLVWTCPTCGLFQTVPVNTDSRVVDCQGEGCTNGVTFIEDVPSPEDAEPLRESAREGVDDGGAIG